MQAMLLASALPRPWKLSARPIDDSDAAHPAPCARSNLCPASVRKVPCVPCSHLGACTKKNI
eukprot:scaffold189655_cov31-Tisochrysis_lutea.AAC.6